ncbi:TT1751-like protein [Amylocystis lapponica]|nr:TT1751-like protein [Amylocystis lapponica]
MSKVIEQFTTQRTTYETSLPVAVVTARLDEALSKGKVDPTWWKALAKASSREEVEEEMHKVNGGKDFTHWYGSNDTPETHLYTFGNPLIAQTMLQHDLRAGFHVPPRLLVLQKADRDGTRVVYILPSSLTVAASVGGRLNEELKKAAEVLDKKLEKLVQLEISSD